MTSSKKNLRVGMAQVDCALGDLDYNIKKTIEVIKRAREKTDFLVFPELSLTGYGVSKDFHKYALRIDDPRLQELAEQAQGVTVCVGAIEETPSFDFYNSLVFMRDGKITHVHRKIYLPNYDIFEEKKYFATGTKFRSFNHESFRVAPFICGDAWNPALVHLAAADEANIFVFSACSPNYSLGGKLENMKSWKSLIHFYAMIYGAYVVFVNRTGQERNLNFYGHSTIIDPFGEEVASAQGNEEAVIIGELGLHKVREARVTLHTMRDENLHFIQQQLSRIIDNKKYL